jgi:hypothetical protein
VSDLRVGAEWVGRRDGDAEGQEREVEDGHVQGGGRDNECHMASGERG